MFGLSLTHFCILIVYHRHHEKKTLKYRNATFQKPQSGADKKKLRIFYDRESILMMKMPTDFE